MPLMRTNETTSQMQNVKNSSRPERMGAIKKTANLCILTALHGRQPCELLRNHMYSPVQYLEAPTYCTGCDEHSVSQCQIVICQVVTYLMPENVAS